MRTAIFLGCAVIAYSINPTLRTSVFVAIMIFLISGMFSYMDLTEFLTRKKKKK